MRPICPSAVYPLGATRRRRLRNKHSSSGLRSCGNGCSRTRSRRRPGSPRLFSERFQPMTPAPCGVTILRIWHHLDGGDESFSPSIGSVRGRRAAVGLSRIMAGGVPDVRSPSARPEERMATPPTVEHLRLEEARQHTAHWKKWGPYLAERQWGTVREDYSPDGTAWEYFPHDHARSRAYRWGEDGLLGISDNHALLCFALALWNGADPILKERLFGLTGNEGNHGEDVKEYYYFLDSSPTHSYMKALYKYPQRACPYSELVNETRRRGRDQPEYELVDTGIFAEDRYFDVFVEYAKTSPDDILIRITAENRGPEPATLHLLPTLWFRNTWTWGRDPATPELHTVGGAPAGTKLVQATHPRLGTYWLACEVEAELLFTENESNAQRLWGVPNRTPYVKDGINAAIVDGAEGVLNPAGSGTKVAAHRRVTIAPGGACSMVLRLSDVRHAEPFAEFADIVARRRQETDEFYATLVNRTASEDAHLVQRQAFAGLLWSKQFYEYDVEDWLEGDPACPPPPPQRWHGRNSDWRHLNNAEVLSMPDTWEYPWYAAWDLGFHCIALALVDPAFAKRQLVELTREWYMHPNGQLPAYE